MRISQQIYPRCVSLITTINKEGKPNVMTASFIMPISFEPKYLAVSIAPTHYSFQNLKETPEFTLNLCEESMLKEAKICGGYSGREKNKFRLAKLETENSKEIKPPLIKNCPISFECKVELMKEFGNHFLIVGKVLEEYIRKKEFRPLLHKSGDEFLKLKQ